MISNRRHDGTCKKHSYVVVDFDGACSECTAETVAAHPEFGDIVRRNRRWRRAAAAYAFASLVVLNLAYWSFMLYREHVIWSR